MPNLNFAEALHTPIYQTYATKATKYKTFQDASPETTLHTRLDDAYRLSPLPKLPGLRAYPNNPLYCGRLQSPMPALSAKNVLNVEKTTPPSIFGLPPWPRTFRSAS